MGSAVTEMPAAAAVHIRREITSRALEIVKADLTSIQRRTIAHQEMMAQRRSLEAAAGIIHSDAAVANWIMYVRRDRGNPRTEITVKTIQFRDGM